MLTKIKVSRKIAEALSYYEANHMNWKDRVIYYVAQSKAGMTSEVEAILLDNEYDLFELSRILVNGYDVEKTPEERLVDYYNEYKSNLGAEGSENYGVIVDTIEITLDILDISIEGINV